MATFYFPALPRLGLLILDLLLYCIMFLYCLPVKLRIPDAMIAQFNVDSAHVSKVKVLENEVKKANTTVVKRALKSSASTPTVQAQTATAGTPNRQNRTSCQPEFKDNDKPLDVSRVVDLASVPELDFRSTQQFLVNIVELFVLFEHA